MRTAKKRWEDDPDQQVRFEPVACTRETDKAILVVFEDVDGEFWIPKSQIHDDSEVYGFGHVGTLVISSWIAKQKDLI